ncbi:hypothetical protein ASZ78_013749 [Callipepla squamata]|uniref:Keratin n=1 Tax=Callipepla squamata TaxID=9009 RepID=A0A226M8W5_CALSU|nr:hypothetical protein ASZ78_013238 [Callipepla squamata]OXB51714.1 hypothetical protein ASZ78_013749 [Callipepla squamata]
MSCYDQCLPRLPCQPCGPTPLANSCNEPCVRQCQDSHVFIQPSPAVVTLPGPILSSFPQNTAVGSSTSAAVGSILSSEGVPINSGGFGLSGFGSRICGRSIPYRPGEANRLHSSETQFTHSQSIFYMGLPTLQEEYSPLFSPFSLSIPVPFHELVGLPPSQGSSGSSDWASSGHILLCIDV